MDTGKGTRRMTDPANIKLRLRYPEYLRGEAEKESVETIFSESGYEYDFAFRVRASHYQTASGSTSSYEELKAGPL